MRRTAYFTPVGGNCCNFWVFYVVFGCTNLVFKNPACVKEMTNMKYGLILFQIGSIVLIDIVNIASIVKIVNTVKIVNIVNIVINVNTCFEIT